MVECIHHWYMGASNHDIVHAKCLKCGAEKDYYNSTTFKNGAVNKNKEVTPDPAVIQ